MVPPAKTKPLRFNEVAVAVVAPDKVHVLPVQSSVLNQLPVVISASVDPPVRDKLGALVIDPPVVPNTKPLVAVIFEVKPPAPVYVNPVAVAILRAIPLEAFNTILFVPNTILRVLVLLELNTPVVKLYPPRFIVGVDVAPNAVVPETVNAPVNVVVPL